MATPRWIGAALPVAQISTITIANTWATADTLRVTVGTREIQLTVGTDTTTALIATALSEMWNGETQTGTGDHTFSDTGSNVPEFAEATATVSGSVVRLTGNTAGKPFTLSATETTAGSGTATAATVTAATGPNHWDNIDNWSTGVLPADADTVYIDNSSVSILYALDQSLIEPTAMHIALSFTGEIGLPEVSDGDYYEYRDQYLKIGPATLKIGAGAGQGSRRMKNDCTTDVCALTVYATGTSADELPALIWKGTNASNSLVQVGGNVGVAMFGAETATLATINKSGGDLVIGAGTTLSGALVHGGGTLNVNSAIATSLTQTAGDTVIDGTGAVALLVVRGGSVVYNTTGTLGGDPVVSGDGVLDFGQNPVAKTVTNPIDGFGTEARILDPLKVVATLIVDGNESFDPGTQVVWGKNLRLTRGAVA